MPSSIKFIVLFLLCFFLNILNHGNIWIGVLNTLLLGLSLYFFQNFSHQKISSIKSPYLILLGTIPLFNHYYENYILIFFAIGIILLFLIYLKIGLKYLLVFLIFLYMFVASLYAGEIIKFPFSLQGDRLIFNDNWTNLAITGMQREALYILYSLRLLIFNSSVYLYVMLSKMAELFMLKNLYDVLLVANLYPLFNGIILDLRSWKKQKLLIISSIFLISFTVVSSRAVDIFNTFLLMSPFLMYFILKGLGSINEKIYILLMIFSLFIVTSPFK